MIEVEPVRTIAISDPHVIALVAREQARRGYGTAAKTAGQLIQERITELEYEARQQATTAREPEPAA